MALLTTAAAIVIGATAGWMVADPGRVPTLPWQIGSVTSEQPGDFPALSASEPQGRSLPVARADGPSLVTLAARHLAGDTGTSQPAGAVWPIVLHRAGDGRFYADLSLDGHLITILVDPAAPASRLTPAELPLAAKVSAGDWQATEVLLEHLRLPPTGFPVVDAPGAEAAIGADLLTRHFLVEEQADRLRLVPRQGQS